MSADRSFFLLLVFAMLASTVAVPAEATTYVPMSDGDLTDQASVVARVRVVAVEPGPASSPLPVTEYLVDVLSVAKGKVPGSTLVVQVPGGLAVDGTRLKIWGAPEFPIGEEPLLFLEERPDGTFRILHLMLGAFHPRRDGSSLLAVPDLSEAHPMAGSEPAGVRDLGRFEAWIEDRAIGIDRSPDYWRRPLGAVESAPRAKFALLKGPDGLPARWFDFDQGRNVAWRLDSGGQPGLTPEQSQWAFETALQAWNDDPTSTIRYTLGGLTAPGTGRGLTAADGVNVALFNDPGNANVPGTFDCRAGGVLAMGGPFFRTTVRSYRGQSYHEILEANIVVQDGTECFFRDHPVALQEVLGHELGHTLGLGHSGEREALLWGSVHDDGRGARLADDDRLAVSLAYGDGSFHPAPPPAPVPEPEPLRLAATASHTTVTLSWSAAPTGTAELWIECRQGKRYRKLHVVEAGRQSVTLQGMSPKVYELRVAAMAPGARVLEISNTVKVRTRK